MAPSPKSKGNPKAWLCHLETSRESCGLLEQEDAGVPIQFKLCWPLASWLFFGVTLVILIQDIHLAPNKFTLQKDAEELASLERRSRLDAARGEAGNQPSPAAGSTGIDLVKAQLQERSQPAVAESTLTAGHANSPDRKRITRSDGAKKLRALKNLRNPQTQRAGSPTPQRYEQRGLSSFFAGIGRALGFSRN